MNYESRPRVVDGIAYSMVSDGCQWCISAAGRVMPDIYAEFRPAFDAFLEALLAGHRLYMKRFRRDYVLASEEDARCPCMN
jgi:hypothetical protein